MGFFELLTDEWGRGLGWQRPSFMKPVTHSVIMKLGTPKKYQVYNLQEKPFEQC